MVKEAPKAQLLGTAFTLPLSSAPSASLLHFPSALLQGASAGSNLPVNGQGVWNLPEGDFSYIDLGIVELEYQPAA